MKPAFRPLLALLFTPALVWSAE
ncbi:MAG: hypothetical protein RJB55_631, partial [Verrucomicrobiota bacterium]